MGLKSAFGSSNWIKPFYACETLKVGVRRVNRAAVFHGSRRKLRVSYEVSSAAGAIEQLANPVPMILIGREHTDVRLN